MSYANFETFPRVLLEHGAIDSTVAIVGLAHVVPQSRIGMYHEVANYARTRLSLPNSVVHYELGESPEIAEEQAFKQKNPEVYDSAIKNEKLLSKVIKLLDFAYQVDSLYDVHAGDGWVNHDATGIEIVEQESQEDVLKENNELKEFYEQLLKASPKKRSKLGRQIFRDLMAGGAKLVEMSDHDTERESIAVNAVLRESLLGMRHFTLLWGMNHMVNLQRAFELQGYKPVKGKTISVLAK